MARSKQDDDQQQDDPARGIDEPQGEQGQDPSQASDSLADNVGAAQVREQVEQAQAQGYYGVTPPGPDNEAYSLQSGPDSPSALEATIAAREADLESIRALKREGGSS